MWASLQKEGKLEVPSLETVARTIKAEYRRREFYAIAALWHVGDVVLRLRAIAPSGRWREEIRRLAILVQTHPKYLDDAATASRAFTTVEREALLWVFEALGADISPSHVIE